MLDSLASVSKPHVSAVSERENADEADSRQAGQDGVDVEVRRDGGDDVRRD
jgi:hypothetical protein